MLVDPSGDLQLATRWHEVIKLYRARVLPVISRGSDVTIATRLERAGISEEDVLQLAAVKMLSAHRRSAFDGSRSPWSSWVLGGCRRAALALLERSERRQRLGAHRGGLRDAEGLEVDPALMALQPTTEASVLDVLVVAEDLAGLEEDDRDEWADEVSWI